MAKTTKDTEVVADSLLESLPEPVNKAKADEKFSGESRQASTLYWGIVNTLRQVSTAHMGSAIVGAEGIPEYEAYSELVEQLGKLAQTIHKEYMDNPEPEEFDANAVAKKVIEWDMSPADILAYCEIKGFSSAESEQVIDIVKANND